MSFPKNLELFLGQRMTYPRKKKALMKLPEESFTVLFRFNSRSLEGFIRQNNYELLLASKKISSCSDDEFFELKGDIQRHQIAGQITGDQLIARNDVAKSDERTNLDQVVFSLGYQVEAETHLEKGEIGEAWIKIAKARFHCGMASMVADIPDILRDVESRQAKEAGERSALTMNAELQALAFDFARQLVAKEGKCFIEEAAKKVAQYLSTHAKSHNRADGKDFRRVSSGKSGVKTAINWLKEMPDRMDLFKPD